MSKRKRFNPLEESLPEEISLGGGEGLHPVAAMAVPESAGLGEGAVERIERLPPSQMIPDRFQPRRLLPGAIRKRFFDGKIDCYQAASEWLALAAKDVAWRDRLSELLAMGGSFESHGQIKPITGSWQARPNGTFVFQIETGERRFWAACLRSVKDSAADEVLLRVEVVKAPTRHRQVLENRHAQSPSAIGQACEIAALILEEMDIRPDPDLADEFDYFRQAARRRAPRGIWPKIEPVMQFSTRRMQQLLSILNLSNEQLELADRNRMPERVLREVLALPEDEWDSALRLALKEGLTAEHLAEHGAARKDNVPKERGTGVRGPERVAYGALRKFLKAVDQPDPDVEAWLLDDVADELITQGDAERTLELLQELGRRIQARLSRRA
jgi:hypothetical protein